MPKVKFGLSDVHVRPHGGSDPMTPVKGAVSLTMSPESSEQAFWADNIAYYIMRGASSVKGALTMALFPDEFKLKYLGYEKSGGR